jgi:hypothetical protein
MGGNRAASDTAACTGRRGLDAGFDGRAVEQLPIGRLSMGSRLTRIASLSLLTVVAAGCGGGGDDDDAGGGGVPPATVKGTFVDSPVGNLGYSCGSGANLTSGVTDGIGQFDYVPPATGTAAPLCTFKVGDIVLGTAAAAAQVTPFDLVPGATMNDSPLNPTVVNIARFLQSIDSDGNGSNGISIQAETNAALKNKSLDFSSPNFDALAAALLLPAGKTLVGAANAGDALKGTFLAVFAGNYSCTYSGVVNGANTVLGTVAVTIVFDTLTGIGTPTYPTVGAPFDVDGSITPGGVTNTSTSTGATFAGSFTSGGTAATTKGSGTWTDPDIGSGTWACQHD